MTKISKRHPGRYGRKAKLCLWVVATMPSVRLTEAATLPKVPGLYYAVRAGRCLYVGKANSLHSRWNSRWGEHHELEGLLKLGGVRLYYQPRPLWRLGHDEAVAIDKYQPPLNGRRERKVWWIALLDALTGLMTLGVVAACVFLAWKLVFGGLLR